MISPADLIGNGFGEFLTVWFIGIFIEHSRKLFSGNGIQTPGCTDAGFLIQAQIQRSVCFKRETSFGVINLHGGNTEICKNKVKSSNLFGNLINGAEVLKLYCQQFFPESLLCQTFLCFGGFLRVYICCINMALAIQTLKHRFRMAAIAQCGIKSGFARLDIKKIKDFLNHNGDMHSRRGISFLNHVFNGIFIFLRL